MTYPTMQQVAEYIDDARRGQGLSMKKFAELSGLSARTVKVKLAGERPIKTSDLHRFAVALGTTPGQIYLELASV
jgi:transcriptional regulator with XRE-family HTH domain